MVDEHGIQTLKVTVVVLLLSCYCLNFLSSHCVHCEVDNSELEMSSWCLFFDPHQTTHQTNVGDSLINLKKQPNNIHIP